MPACSVYRDVYADIYGNVYCGSVATPTTASLSLATFAPVVTAANSITVTPGVASLTITAYAATVTATDSIAVMPSTASLTLAAFAPNVIAITPPTDVVATALSSSSIGLSWTHPGGAVTFELQRRVKVGV